MKPAISDCTKQALANSDPAPKNGYESKIMILETSGGALGEKLFFFNLTSQGPKTDRATTV